MLFIPQENVVPDITIGLTDNSLSVTALALRQNSISHPLVQNTEIFTSLPVIHQYQKIPLCVETQTQQKNQKNTWINVLI